MVEIDVPALVAEELGALADVLESLPEQRWDTPSLCEQWRVREVVAHMTMAARYDEQAFLAELRAVNFDFTTLSNSLARRDARLPTAELVAGLRSEAMQRWTPPEAGWRGALSHAVIHGLDVTVPLGSPRFPRKQALRLVLQDLTTGGVAERFGVELEGRCLVATDLDLPFGQGSVVKGRAADLVLYASGRSLPAGHPHTEPDLP
jgi:uncharacterized protein (TIGR03083 family)